MRTSDRIAFAAAIGLHAAVFAWQPMSLTMKRNAGPQSPGIMVTLVQAAVNVVNTAPLPPAPAPKKPNITPPKPMVDKPLKPTSIKESPAPTVSGQSFGENSSPGGDTSAPLAPGVPVGAAEVLAAAPVKAPIQVETARPDHAHNPPPDYPALARRFGLSGRVLMRVLVEASGEAREVRIAGSSGHEVLDQAALKSVRSWRFLPARRGSDTFAAWVEFPVKFELTN